jgi:hypothetical protein
LVFSKYVRRAVPRRLKPESFGLPFGTTEVVPFPNRNENPKSRSKAGGRMRPPLHELGCAMVMMSEQNLLGEVPEGRLGFVGAVQRGL